MQFAALLVLSVASCCVAQHTFTRQKQAIRSKIGNHGQRGESPQQLLNPPTVKTTTTSAPTTKPTEKGTLLVPPVPKDCANRPKHWQLNGHWYFYSADVPEFQQQDNVTDETVGKRFDWLDSRNLCRRFCMDSISIETKQEWDMLKTNISDRGIIYIWSSGRLCDFKGCSSRADLKPLNRLGWFWSGTNVKISDTSITPIGWETQPWSQTGHTKKPQPDNAEFDINRTSESCLGLLNNIYSDGVSWHDIACYHKKPVVCEDSAVLLNYARAVSQRDGLQLDIN